MSAGYGQSAREPGHRIGSLRGQEDLGHEPTSSTPSRSALCRALRWRIPHKVEGSGHGVRPPMKSTRMQIASRSATEGATSMKSLQSERLQPGMVVAKNPLGRSTQS